MSEPSRRGPQPARTDRPAPAALRVLRALVETDAPATIADLTARLGGHPNTVRNQLDNLVDAGFAELAVRQSGGRGRPSHVWTATLAGHQVAGQDERLDGYSALIEALADHLSSDPDPWAAAVEVGRAWGRRLPAGEDGPGRSDVSAVLAAQGFTPTATPDGILLQTCPMLEAARRCPDVICRIHQGMLQAAAESAVVILPFATPAGCLVQLESGRS